MKLENTEPVNYTDMETNGEFKCHKYFHHVTKAKRTGVKEMSSSVDEKYL